MMMIEYDTNFYTLILKLNQIAWLSGHLRHFIPQAGNKYEGKPR